jgi:hypothetical protein
MASNPTRDRWKAAGLCGQCGHKPSPGRKCCPRCIAKQQARDAAKRTTPIVGKWKPGGPGRPPVWARVKGVNVEPQCQPSKGPMRAEHEWDDEVGMCTRCAAKRPEGFVPSAAPEVQIPEAVQIPAFKPTAADKLKRSPGPRGTVAPLTRDQKQRFHAGVMLPAPMREPLTPGAPPFVPVREVDDTDVAAGVMQPRPEVMQPRPASVHGTPADVHETPGSVHAEDVVTYRDPVAAVIAELELELTETQITLARLRRMQQRKTA